MTPFFFIAWGDYLTVTLARRKNTLRIHSTYPNEGVGSGTVELTLDCPTYPTDVASTGRPHASMSQLCRRKAKLGIR
jgi:hypothetical protein